MSQSRILVVEDEDKLRRALSSGLAEQGYAVTAAADGKEGLSQVFAQAFDAIVLDRMLPGLDGMQILAELRRRGLKTPVLMLTARAEVEDRVAGLDAGADDYLAKPFSWVELVARVRACLRRSSTETIGIITVGPLRLDCVQRCLLTEGEPIELTDRECDLLQYFMRRAGQTVTREQLSRDVWREPPEVGSTNVMDVYVAKLRKRLERIGEQDRIKTVRGSGYLFEA